MGLGNSMVPMTHKMLGAVHRSNQDLWERFWNSYRRAIVGGRIRLKKVKAHCKAQTFDAEESVLRIL